MLSPFQLSQADNRAMYLQIMDNIKQLVVSGEWQASQALPSIREMAVLLMVSVITVKRAYQELETEGVIVTRHGLGSFVAEETGIAKQQKNAEIEKKLTEVVELAVLLGLGEKELLDQLSKIITTRSGRKNGIQ